MTDPGSLGRPSGTVTFTKSAGDNGAFSPAATCTLPPTGTNQCSVTYTPSAKGDGSHGITATYNGDATFLTSTATTSITVGLRATITQVSCSPSVVVQTGTTMTCTATVIDNDPAGTKLPPTGMVTFTRDGGLPLACSPRRPAPTDRVQRLMDLGHAAGLGGRRHIQRQRRSRHKLQYRSADRGLLRPVGGFVTGGGYIKHEQGPTNPYYPDIVGKDNFGFNAKYQKSDSIPTGETEFQCKVCGHQLPQHLV